MVTMSDAYRILREVAPGAGGRSKSGGYDLVTADTPTHRHTGYLTLTQHGMFHVSESEVHTFDPVVIEHLKSHGILVIK